MPRKITITIEPDGSTSVKTEGYPGASCRDATRDLEKALGTRAAETLTAEFHQNQGNTGNTTQRA